MRHSPLSWAMNGPITVDRVPSNSHSKTSLINWVDREYRERSVFEHHAKAYKTLVTTLLMCNDYGKMV